MASIKGRARQRVQAALRKAYEDETINQCFDKEGKLINAEVPNESRLRSSAYYI